MAVLTAAALLGATGTAGPSLTVQPLSLGKNLIPQFTLAWLAMTDALIALVISAHFEGQGPIKRQARRPPRSFMGTTWSFMDIDRSSTMRTLGATRWGD